MSLQECETSMNEICLVKQAYSSTARTRQTCQERVDVVQGLTIRERLGDHDSAPDLAILEQSKVYHPALVLTRESKSLLIAVMGALSAACMKSTNTVKIIGITSKNVS